MPADDLNRWIADLANAIARATAQDPMSPEYLYHTGVVMLAFTVYPDGGVGDIRVVGSSGDDSLDRRAVAKLRRADPLPAGPEEARPRGHVAVVSVAERILTPANRAMPADIRTFATA
ncbi:energy transducer TonB family protein [Sphingomonas sp. GB1N7]|uniref:energy transducer TonB family protein n=1 Tax=Parasphingomonas caseinilytica TaxID=3096158 RepID=UPI002FC94825